MRKFNVGDTVYLLIDRQTSPVECVIEPEPEFPEDYKLRRVDGYGAVWVHPKDSDRLFATREEATAKMYELTREAIQEYKDEIKTVKDLLRFPLEYCLCGTDCDYDAVRAYTVRAAEILGMSLSD